MTAPAQPTPGPWFNYGEDNECDPPEPGKKWLTIATQSEGCIGDEICVIVRRDPYPITDEDHANARLIAAAPELLAALEALVGTAENEGEVRAIEAEGMIDAADMQGYELGKCIKQARALLAVIRGAR